MGTIINHALIVTASDDDIAEAHAEATRRWSEDRYERPDNWNGNSFSQLVSPIIPCVINGGGTFMIGVDGSKECWDASDFGELLRAEFIEWLRSQDYRHQYGDEERGSRFEWVEIEFGSSDNDYKYSIRSHQGDDQ